MWVFGYGSLMWDGWEKRFDGRVAGKAQLVGYHRAFNKTSTKNWGTKKNPGPTLGLERNGAATCVGLLFQLPDARRDEILAYLRNREGGGFALREDLELRREDGSTVQAVTPVNDPTHPTYIGSLSLTERVQMTRSARGVGGRCIDYVVRLAGKLDELGIADPHVHEFWSAVTDS